MASTPPTDLATVRALVDASAYPNAEIHLTEWNSSSSPRDHTHDHFQAATYVVKANLEAHGLVDSLAYWTFTDVFEENVQQAGQEPFHGGFGLLGQHGISKPTMHAYRMLAALGNELLHQKPGAVVTRHSATGAVTTLLSHYPAEVTLTVPASFDTREVAERTLATGSPEHLSIRIAGLAPNQPYQLEVVDVQHGNTLSEWQRLGSPTNPSRNRGRHDQDQCRPWSGHRTPHFGRRRAARRVDPAAVGRRTADPARSVGHSGDSAV